MTDFDIQPPQPTKEQEEQWWPPAHHWPNHYERYQAICKAIAWATPIVAQQAADAELEACKKFVLLNFGCDATNRLHEARRSDSLLPSLKAQALSTLMPPFPGPGYTDSGGRYLTFAEESIIRRALESIPDEPPT